MESNLNVEISWLKLFHLENGKLNSNMLDAGWIDREGVQKPEAKLVIDSSVTQVTYDKGLGPGNSTESQRKGYI